MNSFDKFLFQKYTQKKSDNTTQCVGHLHINNYNKSGTWTKQYTKFDTYPTHILAAGPTGGRKGLGPPNGTAPGSLLGPPFDGGAVWVHGHSVGLFVTGNGSHSILLVRGTSAVALNVHSIVEFLHHLIDLFIIVLQGRGRKVSDYFHNFFTVCKSYWNHINFRENIECFC